MKIVKGTEPIRVKHPIFLIFGPPGMAKTSVAYSGRDTLLLDVDQGAHRAANRTSTMVVDTWADLAELTTSPAALDPYKTIAVDTLGRAIDVLTTALIREDPKNGRGGGQPSQQGWGHIKSQFKSWLTDVRALGKDIILVAHEKVEKDGDVRVFVPDVAGGSYGEILKIADFVGHIHMLGNQRVIDFNPTERWIGKNPGRWAPIPIPDIAKATEFMAALIDKGRDALGAISDQSAQVLRGVTEWREAIDGYQTPDEFTRAVAEANKLAPILQPQVKKLLSTRAKTLGFTYDTKAAGFVAPAAAAEPVEATA